jgi:predicted nucleotidyltransferase
MKKSSFDTIAHALNQANVPFLVVGGIAVINHGYGRATKDVDLVVRLESEIIVRAFHALAGIGYRPAVPISAEQFADPLQREAWRNEKGMKVLRFWSDAHRETPLDVFVSEPFDFLREYEAAAIRESAPGVAVRIVTLSTLLAMKLSAGRPQDLADIDELNLLHNNPSSYDRENQTGD